MRRSQEFGKTYVLMAGKSKNNDRETAKGRDRACPMADTNGPPISHGVALHEMVHDQDDQVCH